MITNYLKIAWRNLIRNKGYSFINIAGLAVALAVFIIIMLFIRHETSYNRHFSDADLLYRILLVDELPDRPAIHTQLPEPIAGELLELYPEVESKVRVSNWLVSGEVLISAGESSFYSEGVKQGESTFFSLFSFPFISGDPERALEEPNTVVVTQMTAERLFGHADVMGETVRLNNSSEWTITGVVQNPPGNSTLQFDLITHRQLYDFPEWTTRVGEGYLKLSSPEAIESLREKMPGYVEENMQISPGVRAEFSLILQPVTDIHLFPESRQGEESRVIYIRILFVVAFLILLMACINYINLTTATAARRAREIGIRKTVGATRSEVMTQITMESVLTCFVSFLLAFALAETLIPYLHSWFDLELISLFSFSAGWIGILTATLLLTGIVSGAYAAVYLSSFQPAYVLKGGGGLHSGRFSGRLRKGLVIAQFAISASIILASLFISQQMEYIQTERLNGHDEQVIAIRNNSPEIDRQFDAFKQELLSHPNIASVSAGTIPNRISMMSGYQDSLDNLVRVHIFNVEYDYLETIGLELVAGRDFDPERSEDAMNATIINETAAQTIGIDESLEGEINIPFSPTMPIGIVRDFHTLTLFDPTGPVVIRIRDPRRGRMGEILVRFQEGGIEPGLEHVRETWSRFEPGIPVNFNFLDEILDRDYRTELQMASIFHAFSGFSILIACLGLFGLSAYTAGERTKEIGIRKVMGATVANIMLLLNRDFLKLVLIGFVIAIPIAWYAMNRWLEDFAYRIEIGAGVFLLAGSAALLIALLTVSWQSIRAAMANPVDSLRSE